MSMQYKGSCHCGDIQFSFVGPEIIDGLRCNCTICQKKGALMSNFFVAPEDISIDARDGAIASYEFGTQVAKHYFCKRCGIYTFHKTKRKPGYYRIHLGCVDGLDVLSLPYVLADGASF